MTAHDNQEKTESDILFDGLIAQDVDQDIWGADPLDRDEGDDFSFVFSEHEKSFGRSRLAAPILGLLLAIGFGGYIFSNSSFFSGSDTVARISAVAPVDTVAAGYNEILPAAGDTAAPLTTTSQTTTTTTTASQPVPAATPAATDLTAPIPSMVPEPSSLVGVPASTPTPADATTATATTTTTTSTATAPTAVVAPSTVVTDAPNAQAPALPVPDATAVKTMPTATAAMPAAMTPDATLPPIGGAAATPGVPTTATPLPASSVTPLPGGSNQYYDASAGGNGAATSGMLRKLDPAVDPASKFIVVEKTEGPQGIDAQVIAADRALKLGRYDAAADMYDALYAKNPRDPRILMGRAVAYQNTGRADMALKTYDELLNVDPGDANALVNMLGLLRTQYPEVALRRLMNLHEKFPNNATVAAQIGVTEGDQGQFEDAMRYLGMAVSMEPNNAQHQFNLAVIADRAGKKDDALKYYEQALETDAVYGGSRSVPRDQIYDRLATLRQH